MKTETVRVKDQRKSFYAIYIKRCFDIFGSVATLILLLPIFLVIALLIKIDSPGPIIFKQRRIGQFKKEFHIFKFRTMIKNADKIGPTSTKVDDNRITKIGNIFRKLSLDELPQLLNVFLGQMSFVGYRPGVSNDYTSAELKEGVLFIVKPGITGYAQVNGRSSLKLEEKRSWEKKYIQEISVHTDFKILIKTISVVLKLKDII